MLNETLIVPKTGSDQAKPPLVSTLATAVRDRATGILAEYQGRRLRRHLPDGQVAELHELTTQILRRLEQLEDQGDEGPTSIELYRAIMARLTTHVRTSRSSKWGAFTVVQNTARDLGVRGYEQVALPRPTRAEREAADG